MNKEIEQYARTLQFKSDNGERYFLDITAGKTSSDEMVLSEHSSRKSTGAQRFLAMAEEAYKLGNKLLAVKEFSSIFSSDFTSNRTFNLTKARKAKTEQITEKASVIQPQFIGMNNLPVVQNFAGFGGIDQFYGGLQGFIEEKTSMAIMRNDLQLVSKDNVNLEKKIVELERKIEVLHAKNENLESENWDFEKENSKLEDKANLGNLITNGISTITSNLAMSIPKVRSLFGIDEIEETENQASVGKNTQAQIPASMPPNTDNDVDYQMKTDFVQGIANFIIGVQHDEFLMLYELIKYSTQSKENLTLMFDLIQSNQKK